MRDIDLWLRILGELQADASQSNRRIAATVGAEHHVVARVRARFDADPEELAAELEPERELAEFWERAASLPPDEELDRILLARETWKPPADDYGLGGPR